MKVIVTHTWDAGQRFWGAYDVPGELHARSAEKVAVRHVERNTGRERGTVVVRPADGELYPGSVGYQVFVFDVVEPKPQPRFALERR